MKNSNTNRTALPAVNKYPFNCECAPSFLSNCFSILKHFPMAMMSRRDMPTKKK